MVEKSFTPEEALAEAEGFGLGQLAPKIERQSVADNTREKKEASFGRLNADPTQEEKIEYYHDVTRAESEGMRPYSEQVILYQLKQV